MIGKGSREKLDSILDSLCGDYSTRRVGKASSAAVASQTLKTTTAARLNGLQLLNRVATRGILSGIPPRVRITDLPIELISAIVSFLERRDIIQLAHVYVLLLYVFNIKKMYLDHQRFTKPSSHRTLPHTFASRCLNLVIFSRPPSHRPSLCHPRRHRAFQLIVYRLRHTPCYCSRANKALCRHSTGYSMELYHVSILKVSVTMSIGTERILFWIICVRFAWTFPLLLTMIMNATSMTD